MRLFPLFVLLASCSSSSPPAGESIADAATDGTQLDGASVPDCGPTATVAFDAGTPGTFAGEAGAACTRDIDCAEGTFCVVVSGQCAPPSLIVGPGKGGHAADGGACVASPAFAMDCDSLSLAWSAPQVLSQNAGSVAESDVALVADGHGTLLAAWANNTTPNDQFNGQALSIDGGPFSAPAKAPSFAASYTSNDVELAMDGSGVFYQLWEEFGPQFQGAQHIYVATSHDGQSWSTPLQVDTPADTGGTIPLDFPDIAINPANQEPYFTYQVTTSSGVVPLRLVIGAPGGAGVSSSVELDDGLRPGADRDLANGAFDDTGSFYVAWVEMAGSGGSTGQGLESGDPGNAVYAARFDLTGTGGAARAGPDVQASGKGEAVLFGLPEVHVTPDGSSVYIVYEEGKNDAIDLHLVTSHDRGQTFGAPVRVNDDATCATHYKSASVLDAQGRLWVLWYDNRDGAGHIAYTVSDDGGQTFHPNRLVTPYAFPFETFQYSVGWLGDYFAVTTTGTEIYAAWSDPHEGDRSHVSFVEALLPQ